MAKKYTIDEEIINEYRRLHTELGTTQACCDAVLDLSENKPEPYKSILKGLIHTLKGDGIEITSPRYEGEDEYAKAYAIFEEVQSQIKNKKGLLYLFVEVQRIDALALCFTKPIMEIETLFDNIKNKFKDDKTPAIQAQIAQAMLSKGFILCKYANLAKSNGYENEYKKLFKKSEAEAQKLTDTYDKEAYLDNSAIQRIISKNMANIAVDKSTKSEDYKKESIDKYKEIIQKYQESNNIDLQKQVALAMFTVAIDLHTEKVTKEAQSKEEMLYSQEKETTNEQVIEEYDKIINKFKSSSIYGIQQNVLLAMQQKAKLYSQNEDFENLITLYDDIIETFKNEENTFLKWGVAIALDNKEKTKKELERSVSKKKIKEEQDKITEQINKLIDFYPNNKSHLEQLIELIDKRQIIPFIGAGLSHFEVENGYAYPLWGQFINNIYEKYKQFKEDDNRNSLTKAEKPTNYIEMASFLKEKLGQGLFGMEVRNTFKHKTIKEIENFLDNQPHTLLPKVFTNRFVLTTNFDNLIELVYQKNDKLLSPCSVSDVNKMDDINNNVTILYKLHGTIDQPNSIILTKEDYTEHYKPDNEHSRMLSKYLSGNSVLFIGCSLNEDDDIMPFYKKSINYAIFSCDANEREQAEKKLSEKNIIPILFPKNEFHYITDILKFCLYGRKEMENIEYKKDISTQLLIQQAKALQDKVSAAQEKLGQTTVIGKSDDNSVEVKMSGKYDLKGFKIATEFTTKEELEKSILSAMQNAKIKVDETIDSVMSEATSGMILPDN